MSDPPQQDDPADVVRDAAGRSSFRQLNAQQYSVNDAVGGVRGVVEAVLPGAVFVVAFIITRDLMPPLIASLSVAAVLTLVRLIQRTPISQAISGLFGVAVGVVWALVTGEPEDFFVMGLFINAAYLLAVLISILLRWPVVGVVVALLRGDGFAWRTAPEQSLRRRRFTMASWIWVAMFAIRLAVQVPLYLSAEVAWLGTARLAMGIPLWALVLYLTWILVREPAAPDATPVEGAPESSSTVTAPAVIDDSSRD